ncbi:hypothetical protein NMY22_g11260 [Coprinellus aureogranulatus]|nr:hypothetical protein NMY22_g11260 [Coprinellus aureogranulatus]
MHLAKSLFAVASMTALTMLGVFAAEGDVHTATKVYQTVVSQSPFLVEQTTMVTWTQSASVAESTTATPIPDTVETGTPLAR